MRQSRHDITVNQENYIKKMYEGEKEDKLASKTGTGGEERSWERGKDAEVYEGGEEIEQEESQAADKVDYTARRHDKVHCAGRGHDEELSYARYQTGRKSCS